MPLTERDITRVSLILIVSLLGVLVFLVLRPVLLSVFGGLILAFIFYPVYKLSVRIVKNKTLSAGIVSILVLAAIFVPLWFLIPVMSQRVFDLFQLSQSLDINGLIKSVMPTASEQFVAQVNAVVNSALSKVTSTILDSLISFVTDFATIALHLLVAAFVFFFSLRDNDRLRAFASDLSPLNKSQEKSLVKQFKDITESIVYGQILLGFLQGILAGIGFFIFGVDNVLVLTALSILFGVIPLVGPAVIYVPVAIYLFVTGNPLAIVFLLYNLLIVSTVDNVIRSHLVSRKTDLSQAIVLVGMIGGFLVFGILGLILGPLVMAYFVTFMRAYKEKTLSSLFSS